MLVMVGWVLVSTNVTKVDPKIDLILSVVMLLLTAALAALFIVMAIRNFRKMAMKYKKQLMKEAELANAHRKLAPDMPYPPRERSSSKDAVSADAHSDPSRRDTISIDLPTMEPPRTPTSKSKDKEKRFSKTGSSSRLSPTAHAEARTFVHKDSIQAPEPASTSTALPPLPSGPPPAPPL